MKTARGAALIATGLIATGLIATGLIATGLIVTGLLRDPMPETALSWGG